MKFEQHDHHPEDVDTEVDPQLISAMAHLVMDNYPETYLPIRQLMADYDQGTIPAANVQEHLDIIFLCAIELNDNPRLE